MKPVTMLLLSLFVCSATLFAGAARSDTAMTTMKPTIVTPDTLKWTQGPGAPKGVMMAVVEGNPDSGPYVARIKLPAGTVFPAHFHGDTERVTVLSGTCLFGVGDVADKTNAKAYGPGSYVSVPKGLHHFAIAQTDVMLQISGVGPMTTTMVKK